jgi:uncharacterized protein
MVRHVLKGKPKPVLLKDEVNYEVTGANVWKRAPSLAAMLDTAVDAWNAIEFVSDPFPAPIEMSGLFSGHVDFLTNKKDFDFEIDLYEVTPKGEYIQLAPYWSRASYLGNRSLRRLLTPGKRARLDFQRAVNESTARGGQPSGCAAQRH